MKKTIFVPIVSLVAGVSLLLGSPQERTALSGNEFVIDKPYYLEIAFGNTSGDAVSITTKTTDRLNASFLEEATILRIAAAPTDTGAFEEVDKYKVEFSLVEQDDDNFELEVEFRVTQEDRHRAISSNLILSESKWVILSGLSEVASDGQPRSYIAALRITPRTIKPEDGNGGNGPE